MRRFQGDESAALSAAGGEPGVLDDYRLLASGLEDLLARCTHRTVVRDFGMAAKACKALQIQLLQRPAAVSLPAAVLNDLAHEIALCADAATRGAARRCLLRVRERNRALATPVASPIPERPS